MIDFITRVDVRPNDPLFSSSSECGSDGQVPEADKPLNASKAKIFPMEKGKGKTVHFITNETEVYIPSFEKVTIIIYHTIIISIWRLENILF